MSRNVRTGVSPSIAFILAIRTAPWNGRNLALLIDEQMPYTNSGRTPILKQLLISQVHQCNLQTANGCTLICLQRHWNLLSKVGEEPADVPELLRTNVNVLLSKWHYLGTPLKSKVLPRDVIEFLEVLVKEIK